MKYFISYFLCIISVYFPILITTLRIDRTANVEELIVKILESDKFDLLANRIAERAVEKMKNLHNVSITRTGNAEELNFQSSGQRNYSADAEYKLSDLEKSPKRESSPFDNLSLKYKKFVKNNPVVKKHKKDASKDTKELNNNISGEFKPTKKRKRKNVIDSGNSSDLKKNKSKNKQSNNTNSFDATKEGDGDVKQKINKDNKSVSKEKGNESEDNYSDDKHFEINSSKNTAEINFKSSKKGGARKIKKKQSKDEGKKKKSKRILRKENDRLYYLESSSDYDPYRDKIYDTLQR